MKEIVERYSEDSNILVLVLDFETLDCEEVVATDISSSGCKLMSTNLGVADKVVGLRLSGVDKMIKGRIREVRPDNVSIAFEFKDDVNCEKRKERRRPVSIAAHVSSGGAARPFPCRIVDASLSGCRLHCENLELLTDSLILKIPGMDLPVRGAVMWRNDCYAGVKMMWQFSGKSDFQDAKKIKAPQLANKIATDAQPIKLEAPKANAPFGLKRLR